LFREMVSFLEKGKGLTEVWLSPNEITSLKRI